MAAVPPLTTLSDDERLFQDSVYEFADREIRPLVRDMDEHAKIPRSLIDKLFGLGVMGIEIPEASGGGGARVLPRRPRGRGAVARRSVDRRARRRAEHAGHQRASALGQRRAQAPLSAAAGGFAPVGAYALSEAGSGSDAFALTTRATPVTATRRLATWVLTGRKLWITNANEADLFIVFANADPAAGLPRHHGVPRRARLRRILGRQEGRQARDPRQQHVRAAPRGVPRAALRTCSARSAKATRSRSRRSTKGASASARR